MSQDQVEDLSGAQYRCDGKYLLSQRGAAWSTAGSGYVLRGLRNLKEVVLSFIVTRVCALALVSLALIGGCGGDQKSADTPSSAATDGHGGGHGRHDRADKGRGSPRETHKTKKARRAKAEPRELPTECVHEGKLCVPPVEFVNRLCKRSYPEVAVYMMRKDQPWTHRYVRVEEAPAVNSVSGRLGEEKLLFGEEIIVLRYHNGESSGAMQVSGTERYEVLRWDGSCATLAEGELVEHVPKPQMRYIAPVWKRLGPGYRAALREHEAITLALAKKDENCKGAGLGRPPACHAAIEGLNRAVAEAVRDGVELPRPREVP